MLPSGPAQAAVTCDDEWERGTLSVNNDGTTSWAVSADGTDARKVCSGATDGDTLRYVDLNPPTIPAGALRVVIAVADSALNYLHMAAIADRDAVLTGTVGGGLKTGVVFIGTLRAPPEKSITLTSYADIDVSGQDSDGIGHGGIYFYNQDPAHTSLLQGINRGSVTTSGDVYAHGIHWLSDAVAASAEARVVNEGTVKTTGTGSRGVYARISNSESQASATAINRGASATITTEGDHYYDSEEDEIVGSDGLAAYNDGNGDAIATNEAGATITVEGSGARGVYAEAGKGGTALATNSGTVTSKGDTALEGTGETLIRRTAGGVGAGSRNGLARAVNESSGSIVTGEDGDSTVGRRNFGLVADNWGGTGRAEAVNRGMVTTYGDPLAVAVLEAESKAPRSGSRGVLAWSRYNSSHAKNESGGSIRTEGLGASGLQAEAERGGSDESATAVNEGTITTTGSRQLVGTNAGSAGGIRAITGAGAKAVARNSATGTVTVEGDGVRGLEAFGGTYGGVDGATGGAAEGVNSGSITTKGDAFHVDVDDTWIGAHGMDVYSSGADATATNEAGAEITTSGKVAFGVRAWSRATNATATNRGTITTTGASDDELPGTDVEFGSSGLVAWADIGNATALNDTGGTITTGGGTDGNGDPIAKSGDHAYGVVAMFLNDGASGSAKAEARNKGAVETKGDNAYGVLAVVLEGEIDAEALVVNEGTVKTTGAGSDGVVAYIADDDSYAGATAINRGASATITTEGDHYYDSEEDEIGGSDGLAAYNDGNGNAIATNEAEATITVKGSGARGVYAEADKGGAALATNSGTVTSEGDAAFEVGTGGEVSRRIAGGVWAQSHTGLARAVNEAVGTVSTSGKAAYGVYAGAYGTESGNATATNRGTITTTGAVDEEPVTLNEFGSRGLVAWADAGNATAVNDTDGKITTGGGTDADGNPIFGSGGLAFGIFALTGNDGASASAVAEARNKGTVETKGYNADGVVALAFRGGSAANPNIVRAYNEAGALIATSGDGSGGLRGGIAANAADADGTLDDAYGSVLVRNDGTVETTGGHGNADVRTDNAYGISAGFYTTNGTTIVNAGDVTAHNTGTIIVSGAKARGIQAITFGTGKASVIVDGDADDDGVVDGGTVTASHDDADDANDGTAIYASTGGLGSIDADIRYGAYVKGSQAVKFENAPATLDLTRATLEGRVDFAGLDDSFTVDSGRVYGRVDMGAGNDTLTVNNGGNFGSLPLDDGEIATEPDLDTPIFFGAGNDRLVVNHGGYFKSAIHFGDDNDTLTLGQGGGYFDGAIDFGAGADTMIVNNGGYFGGDIDFGANPGDAYDTLTLVNGGYFDGAITGLETFTGSGEIRLANVTFSGSSAEFQGGSTVNLTGDFDLGSTGTMTIADGARINAIATKPDQENVLPVITAGGGITCAAGNCTFFLLNDETTVANATADDIEGGLFGTYMVDDGNGNMVTRTTAFADGTEKIVYKTEDNNGEEMTLGETGVTADGTATDVDLAASSNSTDLGSITLETTQDPMGGSTGGCPQPCPDSSLPDVEPLPGGGGSGGGGGAGAVIGVGLLALLLGLFDFEPAVALSGFGPGGAADPASPKPAFVQSADGSSHYWARSLAQALPAGGAGSSGGVEFGMDVGVGNGFTLGFAAAPEVAAERSVDAQHATALSGGRYSLRGGWRGESLFAGLSVSHADWRVEGAYSNPAAGGGLHSSFDAVQNDLRLGVGARIGLGGGLALVPQAEAFAGEVDRESHMAEGADFRAAMPGLTQRYSGVKVGLGLASSWQEGPDGLKLRPSLKLSAMRARTGSQSFDLEQSHRSGLIATSSRARLADAPQTVFGLGAGLDAVSDGGLKLKFGYGVLVDDGKLHHAVAAGLKLDF